MSANSFRRQKSRSLAEVDFVNSSAFRQCQFLLQLRQQRLLRNRFDRLSVHDKELTEMKTFFRCLRQVEKRPQYEIEDFEIRNDSFVSQGDIFQKYSLKNGKEDDIGKHRRRSASAGDIRRRIENLDRPLGAESLSDNIPRSADDGNKQTTELNRSSSGFSKLTQLSQRVNKSQENEFHLPEISHCYESVGQCSQQGPEKNLRKTDYNKSSDIQTGILHLSVESSSDDESSFAGDEDTSRRRYFKDTKAANSTSLDFQTPTRSARSALARSRCLKQLTLSHEKNMRVFRASQKNILQRRKSSSDVFSTKQLTPGQLVELQYKRDRSASYEILF